MSNKLKIGIVVAVVVILIVTIVGCSKANNNRQTEYKEVWTTHYQNGRYDPYYDYGLGSRMENGRRIYVVPQQAPKTVINNYNNNSPQTTKNNTVTTTPSKPAPTAAPKPTDKPTLKIETSKQQTQAPKVNTPAQPKPAAPKPPAPKPAAPKPAK